MDVVGFFLYISNIFSVVLLITSVIKNVISLNYFFLLENDLKLRMGGFVLFFNSYSIEKKVINII